MEVKGGRRKGGYSKIGGGVRRRREGTDGGDRLRRRGRGLRGREGGYAEGVCKEKGEGVQGEERGVRIREGGDTDKGGGIRRREGYE